MLYAVQVYTIVKSNIDVFCIFLFSLKYEIYRPS